MHELSAVEAMVETALAKAEEVSSPRVVGMHFHQRGRARERRIGTAML